MILDKKDIFYKSRARGRMGFSAGVGFARCGYSRCGADKNIGGIYKKQKKSKNFITTRFRYYTPTYRRVPSQNTNRNAFASAVLAWQGLTPLQKSAYNKRAGGRRISGYNLFISESL